MSRVVTTRDVAEACGVAPTTARKWARDGALPAVRIGERGRWRIPQATLDELIGRAPGAAEETAVEPPRAGIHNEEPA
jgi:excisionase family DNA binding protein